MVPAAYEILVKHHGAFESCIPKVLVGGMELVGRDEIDAELEPAIRQLIVEKIVKRKNHSH